jgi:hypothetical protein
MLSKSITAATMLILCAACRSLPWADEVPRTEVNLSFQLVGNLIFLPSALVDGQEGRFILATAAPRTIVDPRFPLAPAKRNMLVISEKESLHFTPQRLDLGGVADALIGADVWGNKAVSIDYVSGLVTYQKEGIYPEGMSLYEFTGEPMITALVDGRKIGVVVDTTSPDTLTLPRPTAGRGTANVVIGLSDFGATDVAYANVTRARVGNRLLSRFLVTIDYGKGVVGLWRDPRVRAR